MVEDRPKALVLTGYGINCDYETEYACSIAGFEAQRVHLNDVLEADGMLFQYRLVVFPGGFSFGDDLGAGVAFASKVRFSISARGSQLFDALMEYVLHEGLVLGICNGFQILVRLGIIPAAGREYGKQQVTLSPNSEGYFIDRWVSLVVESDSPNVFTRGLAALRLPVRHGEGRFLAKSKALLYELKSGKHVVLRYCDEKNNPTDLFPLNPNGSEHAIAGICDSSGRIFGLMPHPEAAVSLFQYPDWTRRKQDALRSGAPLPQEGDGFYIFKNAFDYVR